VTNYLLVFVGGGIGACARYWLSGAVYRWLPPDFPYGNLIVNISACFLIGLLMTGFQDRYLLSPSFRIFLAVGVLGGYSTFSSFTYETVMLMKEGEFFRASLNVTASVGGGLLATALGALTGKLL
jgi:CrcB protein